MHVEKATMWNWNITGPVEYNGVMTTLITADLTDLSNFVQPFGSNVVASPLGKIKDMVVYCTYVCGTAEIFPGFTATLEWWGDQVPPFELELLPDPCEMTDVTMELVYENTGEVSFESIDIAPSALNSTSFIAEQSFDELRLNSFMLRADRIEMDMHGIEVIAEMITGMLTMIPDLLGMEGIVELIESLSSFIVTPLDALMSTILSLPSLENLIDLGSYAIYRLIALLMMLFSPIMPLLSSVLSLLLGLIPMEMVTPNYNVVMTNGEIEVPFGNENLLIGFDEARIDSAELIMTSVASIGLLMKYPERMLPGMFLGTPIVLEDVEIPIESMVAKDVQLSGLTLATPGEFSGAPGSFKIEMDHMTAEGQDIPLLAYSEAAGKYYMVVKGTSIGSDLKITIPGADSQLVITADEQTLADVEMWVFLVVSDEILLQQQEITEEPSILMDGVEMTDVTIYATYLHAEGVMMVNMEEYAVS
jgi:hypothetical protein